MISQSSNKEFIAKLIDKTSILINKKPILLFSVLALIGCVSLNIGIFKDYAYLDAHEFIWTANNDPNFKNLFIQGGRFLYGIWSEYVYGDFCSSISDLKWVRLFSLLGCVVFSIQIFSYLLSLKLKIKESALFSFLILTIPSFSVYYSWSATFEIPVVLNISFIAGLLLIRAEENRKFKILYHLIALLLVVISLCLYQSASTAFLLPFVFSFIVTKNYSIKKIINLFIFLGLSFVLYFIVFKLSLHWYNLEPINRTKIDLLQLPLRVVVFYLKELRMLLYGSGILIFPYLFLAIGSIGFFGLFYSYYQKRREINQFYLFILFLVIILPISYLPNLLSIDKYMCSRTIAPAAIIVLFYQFYFFRQLSLQKNTLRQFFLSIAFLSIILSSVNLNYYITRIQHKEYKAIKAAFNRIPLDNTKNIILIKPKNNFLQENNIYKKNYADEFGSISSSRIWVPEPLYNQILKERLNSLNIEKSPQSNYKIKVYELEDMYDDSNSIVINIIDIIKQEFAQN